MAAETEVEAEEAAEGATMGMGTVEAMEVEVMQTVATAEVGPKEEETWEAVKAETTAREDIDEQGAEEGMAAATVVVVGLVEARVGAEAGAQLEAAKVGAERGEERAAAARAAAVMAAAARVAAAATAEAGGRRWRGR